ncbi:MAG TPA: hypothetical protein VGQ57_12725, partial [Polyangiaceae bacterium]|jgi:hypothetical protein|nr:hypothetical protein [Polyangiaceae bacterium]
VGDLYGTVARLRAPLEHPFVDTSVSFDVTRTPTGLRMAIGILGRPRATRVLGHIAVGAIHAAERFAREANTEPLRIESAMIAERTRIDAHFRRGSVVPPPPDPSPVSRRSSGASRLLPSLSDEVARILDASLSPDRSRPSEEPVRRHTPEPRSGRGVDSEPRSSRPLSEAPPPRSEPFIRRSSRPPPGR